MPLFFISYKRQDIDFALQVKDFIEAQQGQEYLAWIDREGINAGDNWKNVIDTAIKQSIGVVVIVTPESIASPYVTYEWSYAMGMNKRVIPLILREPNPDQMPIHAKMQDLHTLFFNHEDESQHEWDALQRELETITERHEIPPAIQTMQQKLYDNIFDEDIRKRIIGTLKDFEHPAAQEALGEFVDAGLPALTAEAGMALAEKSDCTDDRAIKGINLYWRMNTYDTKQIIAYLYKYANEEATDVLANFLDLPQQLRILAEMPTPKALEETFTYLELYIQGAYTYHADFVPEFDTMVEDLQVHHRRHKELVADGIANLIRAMQEHRDTFDARMLSLESALRALPNLGYSVSVLEQLLNDTTLAFEDWQQEEIQDVIKHIQQAVSKKQ